MYFYSTSRGQNYRYHKMLIDVVSVQSSAILKNSHKCAGGFEVLFTMDSYIQSLRSKLKT